MSSLGEFLLFCLGLYFGLTIIRLGYLYFKYGLAMSIIGAQFHQAIATNTRLATTNKIDYDQETIEIAEQIIIQMVHGLKYQRKWMLRHALEHMAVLYTTTIWLSNPPNDDKLHDALDVIKQKFYFMHGTFLNAKKNKVRNHINLFIQTVNGVTWYGKETYDADYHGAGCRIKVVVSIVTPLTSTKYRYLNHI